MTIAQLESMLTSHRGELSQLTKERGKVAQRLGEIDLRIARLSGRTIGKTSGKMGGKMGGGGGRARNGVSLVASMENILKGAGKPLAVGDIMQGVLKSGYKTKSANFRGIVNQTLIKEKQFSSAGRGIYQLKK